jgi:flagellar biogenesis protein FliO
MMQTTEDDSPSNRPPKWMWARQPIFMYLILVAAFVVCAVYVIHRVINLGAAGR